MAHATTYAFTTNNTQVGAMQPKSVMTFTESRFGGDSTRNEDRFYTADTPQGPLLAAIDGITSLTEWTSVWQGHQVTSGWHGAQAIVGSLNALEPTDSPLDLACDISRRWEILRQTLNIPDDEIIGAVACVYVPWDGPFGAFWQLGDCGWGYAYEADGKHLWKDSLNNGFAANSRDADTRAKQIYQLMIDRALDPKRLDLATMDDLAKQGWAEMRSQRKRNSDYSWLRSGEGLMTRMEPVHRLPTQPERLVLVSDGWLQVPQTLADGKRLMAALQRDDPMMIGLNDYGLRAAKGFVTDGELTPYLDDVTWVEATF